MPTITKIPDDQLATWTKPAFGNEQEKATNTENMIRDAVKVHPLLKTLSVRVFAKGSYKNNTNVRRDSDVDVAVEYQDLVTTEYVDGASRESIGNTPYSGDVTKQQFKAAVGEAMLTAFGKAAVDDSGNRVFEVRESSRSLQADVIPCTTFRKYWPSGSRRQGIELILDVPDGKRHINYPDQHYANGVAKNNDASKRFKSVVRIFKNLENLLVDEGNLAEVPAYLMECLGYNVPDETYVGDKTWRKIVTAAVVDIYNYTNVAEPKIDRWTEVNGFKYLFHENQRWTREDAKTFAELVYERLN